MINLDHFGGSISIDRLFDSIGPHAVEPQNLTVNLTMFHFLLHFQGTQPQRCVCGGRGIAVGLENYQCVLLSIQHITQKSDMYGIFAKKKQRTLTSPGRELESKNRPPPLFSHPIIKFDTLCYHSFLFSITPKASTK